MPSAGAFGFGLRPNRAGARGMAIAAVVLVLVVPGFGPFDRPPPTSAAVALVVGLPTGNNWTPAPPPPPDEPFGRADAAVAFNPGAGDGVVFGGRTVGGGTRNDTWINDGDIPGYWIETSDDLPLAPPPLVGAALAADHSLGEFVLFGGQFANGTSSGQTWVFRGLNQWVDLTRAETTAPPAEAGAGIAFDEADGMTVLFSGVGNGSTWTFQNDNWSIAPTGSAPAPRAGEAMAYDPVDRAVLLFGGASASGPLDDTWEFSAGAWRQLTPSSHPPADAAPKLAYDPHGPGMVLYLGDQPDSTWEFANGAWTAVAALGPGTPTARDGAQLYFDSIVEHAILFGGISRANGSQLSDDWGWAVPVAPVDSTLVPAPLSLPEIGALAAVVAIPVALAWFLRRRPPRKLPVTVPRPVSRAAGI